MRLIAENEGETRSIAAIIAEVCGNPDCILLEGDLGAGKTAFVKGFVAALGAQYEEEVTSPTFTICNIYNLKSLRIYHYDFYRLESSEDIRETGIEEALESGICLLEWSEMAGDYLPENILLIQFEYFASESERIISIAPYGNWERRIKEIEHELSQYAA